jgi:hypothetical protein
MGDRPAAASSSGREGRVLLKLANGPPRAQPHVTALNHHSRSRSRNFRILRYSRGRGRWFYCHQAVGDARWMSAVKRSQWTGCLRQKGWRLAKRVRASASTRRDTAIAYIADLNLNLPRRCRLRIDEAAGANTGILDFDIAVARRWGGFHQAFATPRWGGAAIDSHSMECARGRQVPVGQEARASAPGRRDTAPHI